MKKCSFQLLLMSICLILALISCTKEGENNNSPIPFVSVNEKISINDPLYSKLTNVGGWVYLTAGSRGIILYRESNETVRAYDRHCTFDPEQVCSTVDMDGGLLQANDYDCCGSVFGIATKGVLKGPANRPLVEYDCMFDGTYVHVTN